MVQYNGLWLLAVTLLLLGQLTDVLAQTCEPDGVKELEPHFLQPNVSRLELSPGDSTSLVCEVKRSIDPKNPPSYGFIMWWCNSTCPACHQVHQSKYTNCHISMTESEDRQAPSFRSVLNLTDVVSSQASRYYCVAYNDDRTTSNCPGSVGIDVDIQEKAKPAITNHTQKVDVYQGDPFNLTCSASGYPTPRFNWTKDDKAINGGESGTLKKVSAELTDNGKYHCLAVNKYGLSRSSEIEVKVDKKSDGSNLSTAALAGVIATGVLLAIVLILVIFRLSKLRSDPNMNCCVNTCVRGNNNITVVSPCNTTINVPSDRRDSHLSRTDSAHERRTFLHMHDVFIHNHSSDSQFANMIRSKLQDRESHLKVGLWSEVERPDRSSSRNKLLRLRLLNCSRIVLIASEAYLKYDYHAFTSALAKSRGKPESIRRKVIIVRLLKESEIPKDMTKDVMACLEYNVETDSCYFWPRFIKIAMPEQKEILYWA